MTVNPHVWFLLSRSVRYAETHFHFRRNCRTLIQHFDYLTITVTA